ncbi:hypothetical protein JCM11641_003464 [Rhodosporidiobolus odoratus]
MASAQVAEQVFGWLGTILWCIQLFPQVYLNFRRKTTQGLSPLLFVSWVISGAALGVYAIAQNINIPIIVQPHCYGSLCAFIICQILHYDRGYKWYSAYLGGFATYAVVCAGFEVGMVYACRAGEKVGNSGGTMFFGILSDITLTAGFLPQFVEIYKLQEVVGLSYIFLAMDSMGALFSILSLVFKDEKLDATALAGYVAVIILEATCGILALILNPRARRRRAELEAAGGPSNIDTVCTAEGSPVVTLVGQGGVGENGEDVEAQKKRLEAEAEREREVEDAEQILPQVLSPEAERELAHRVAGHAA